VITLGIDVGTTHTKVLALDVDSGRTLALESAPTPTRTDADGEVHRPTEVLALVHTLTSRVAAGLPDPTMITALCVASVGEEVVLLDEHGLPVGDTIAWYDPRGFEEAEAFMAGRGGATALSRRWPPDATFSLFKLMWMRRHRPDAFAAATTWTDLGDFVLHGLGGELAMDWSHASRAGAFDIVQHAWDSASIGAAGVDLAFPRLVASGTRIGAMAPDTAAQLGLPSGIVVASGGHDHLVAAFGAGVRTTSELFLSAGTSEAHLALLDAPVPGAAGDGLDQGCFVDDHTWYAHINIHSGHFFRQWRQLLFDGVSDDRMYAQVEAATAGGINFALTDDLRRGRLGSVPYDATRAQIMRGILEGLAERSAAIVDRLEAISGAAYELVLVAGHPTRVPLWRTLRQAAYGRPMAAVEEPEIAAYGAAVLAARTMTGADHLVASRTSWA
jgi:xylulokinase